MDRFDQTVQKTLAILAMSALAVGIFAPNVVKAQQTSASSARQSAGSENSDQDSGQDNTGQDFTSPENLFQLTPTIATALKSMGYGHGPVRQKSPG
jgi:hypothetical protein